MCEYTGWRFLCGCWSMQPIDNVRPCKIFAAQWDFRARKQAPPSLCPLTAQNASVRNLSHRCPRCEARRELKKELGESEKSFVERLARKMAEIQLRQSGQPW
ncbi:hypothetical protein MBLNU457_g2577t1 [Dothideomycetes sp. NU457]